MTRVEPSSKEVEEVKRSVACTATCGSTTVESLKQLLSTAQSKDVTPQKDPVNPTATRKARSKLQQPKRQASQVSRALGKGTPLAANECAQVLLSDKDQYKLATEVVNAVLKSFTENIAHQRSPKVSQLQKPVKDKTQTSLDRSTQVSSPLEPVSGNVVAKPSQDRLGKHQKVVSTSLYSSTSNVTAQAECGRIALAVLRSSRLTQSKKVDMTSTQVENAMSAFIGKLISLNLHDIAIEELHTLHKLLAARIRIQAPRNDAPSIVAIGDHRPKQQRLANLVYFDESIPPSELLSLVITTQLQVLDLLSRDPSSNDLEALLEHLKLEAECSPGRLIELARRSSNAEAPTLAVRRLGILARTISVMCDDFRPYSHEDRAHLQLRHDPVLRLQYHALFVQIKSRCYELSDHHDNVARDLLPAFCRSFRAVKEATSQAQKEVYRTATRAVDSVLKALGIDMHHTRGCPDVLLSAVRSLCQALMEMALIDRLSDEALIWARLGQSLSDGLRISSVCLCTWSCRVADCELRASSGSLKLFGDDGALVAANRCLDGNLRGDSDELDDLLISINSLRRALMAVATAIPEPQTKSAENREISKACINSLSLCMKYIVRYSGSSSVVAADAVAVSLCQSRRVSAAGIAPLFIEGLVQCAGGCSLDEHDYWATLDRGLQHAVQLLRAIEGSDESVFSKSRFQKSVTMIFDLYWRRFIMLKRGKSRHAEQMFQIFEDWLYPENLLDTHIELAHKYGQFATHDSEFTDVLKVFDGALNKYLDSRNFHLAVQQAATMSPKEIWGASTLRANANQLLLARLKAAVKMSRSQSTGNIVYDNVAATPPARGLLLELQLSSLISLIKTSVTNTEKIQDAITYTVDLILSLYTQSGFPIRRLRVINRTLALQVFHPERSAFLMATKLVCSNLPKWGAFSEDSGLQPFENHLRISYDVLYALQNTASPHRVLEGAIDVWQTYREVTAASSPLHRIEDNADWLEQLEYISSFLAKEGYVRPRCSALELICHIHERSEDKVENLLIRTMVELVPSYLRKGDLERAGLYLLKGQKLRRSADSDTMTGLLWQVSSAQYALASGDLEGSRVFLNEARNLSQKLEGGYQAQDKAGTQSYRFRVAVADYCFTCSSLSELEGDYAQALLYARLSANTLYPLWSRVGKARSGIRDTQNRASARLEPGSPSRELQSSRTSQSARERQVSWAVGPRLFEIFYRLGQLHEHLGLFMETRYYVEQGQGIAKALGANQLSGRANALWNSIMTSCGLINCETNVPDPTQDCLWCPNLTSVEALNRLAKTKQSLGDYHGAMRCYDEAGTLFKTLKEDMRLHQARGITDMSVDLATQLADLSLVGTHLIDKKRPRRRQPGLKKQLESNERSIQLDQFEPSAPSISRLEVEVFHGRTSLALSQGRLTTAQEMLEHVNSLKLDSAQLVHQTLLLARIQVCQILLEISGDLVFGVLVDSAVAFPSTVLTTPARHADRATNAGAVGKQRGAKGLARRMRGDESLGPSMVSFDVAKKFATKLEAALQQMSIAWQYGLSRTPVHRLHQICKLFTKTILMLSAIRPLCSGLLQPQHVSFIEGFSSVVAISSARLALHTEKLLPSFHEVKFWQYGGQLSTAASREQHHNLDRHAFQQQYVDIIPTGWLVLSLSMNESREKLQIAKFRKSCSPFMLSLPLERQGPRESDDEEFEFHTGQKELQNIMEEANRSSQNAKDATTKASHKRWWTERSILDARLKSLLANIEKVWLGGFRGVLSADEYRPELVARFQQSMQNILDKHLPSRQRGGSAAKAIGIKFDISVAELFTGLGNPNDGIDIDEALLDLIYFTIDILQFQGERNAYDEIDFDAMTIEVTDALRQFHEAAKRDFGQQPYQHTVLILDKTLHAIPWESLDCLKGRAISRLPSLECLRDRVLRQREQQASTVSDDFGNFRQSVKRSNGAYILNPSGDLKHTQTLFEEPLQALQSWEGIVEQIPDDNFMAGLLSSKDILLYFGHGCGCQYIRPRDLKRLDQCAVTLLMGCSSGVMKEAGEFESYGTPLSYMQAGSPALLATLWDVTDKDIDRFSMTVLQDWGLLRKEGEAISQQADTSPTKRLRGKAKAKADAASVKAKLPKETVSLCQAVANARDSCTLKYLNGAAPVVYGIPVFVEY